MTMMSPDDECGICGTTRDMHGDKNHQFNMDGQLIPIKERPAPRQEAPQHRDDPKPGVETNKPDAHLALLGLIEVLIEKGVLDARDVFKVLGGNPSS